MKEDILPNRRESLANNFTLKRLRTALENYKPRTSVAGEKNGMYKSGEGEKYVRIRIDGIKVRRSHIVWRVNNRKKIPIGYNIHHKDENKRNDSPDNLELAEADEHGTLNLKPFNHLNCSEKLEILRK